MALQVKKPRRSIAPVGPVKQTPQPTTGAVRPRPASKVTTTPRTSPAPAAPVLEPIKPITPPSVVLPSSTADRATGLEQLGGAIATGNRGLSTLAQGLGGISSIDQFSFAPPVDDPNTPQNEAVQGLGSINTSQLAIDPNDPNSTLAVIGRNLGKNLQFVDDTNLNRNTFAGGLRLTEEGEQRTNADNAITKARQDYETAKADWIDRITGGTGAYGVYKGIVRGANAADDAATAAAIANAPAQAPPPAPPPAANTPAGGQAIGQQVWQTGKWTDTKGVAHPVKYTGGKWWYKTSKGTWATLPGQI